MAVVTAQMVKELREMTLAGMSDCKKALDAAEGDMEKAVVILREKGLASAAKKASRAASEGVVSTVVENNIGFVFEVNCETDFVTKNDGFQAFVTNLHKIISATKPAHLDELLAANYDSTGNVKAAATALVAQIGENITVRRFERVGSGKNFVTSYVHGGGKIGVLVELSGTGIENHLNDSALNDLGKDVALQAAAMKPQYLNEQEIPAETIKAEEEIIRNKFLQQGKPEAALAKIVPSSIKTWFKEICLIDQLFVKDDSKSVAAHVAETGKKLGISDLKVVSFIRLELGQGVEKKAEDFAAEVAATVAAATKM
ncbi:translation elongation factor Ts [Pigmentibacter sp. JX0631]|uniref:translation elongation factor Ts n=1 Tax=Pigmentibacter sp. JX0631 TaxID=2976982 RepID=UPI002468C49A|nr:translation elongation factor Ts [Pigmentibacter sp. JX0631]WGL59173.1 translation elongation factor Ts [Pigmentibacter sp. JX0631]